jgi:hypothetical protein
MWIIEMVDKAWRLAVLLVLPLLAAAQKCELRVGEETVQPNEGELVRIANKRLVRIAATGSIASWGRRADTHRRLR